MEKEAFKKVLEKARVVGRVLRDHPIATGTVGLGVLQGGLGVRASLKKDTKKEESKKFKERPEQAQEKFKKGKFRRAVRSGVVNGAAGALNGALIGSFFTKPKRYGSQSYRRSSSYDAPPAKPPKDMGTPDWLKGVKTKAEAKTKFRQQAGQHHPDRGGDENKMKTVNAEWDSFQKHHFHKLSFVLPGFFDELDEIYRNE